MRTKLEVLKQLETNGLKNIKDVYYNLTTPELYERAIAHGEGLLAHMGSLVVRTGQHTGRSPNDKFIVREPSSEKHVAWGKVNRPIDEKYFDILFSKMLAYVQNKDLYIQDVYVGADPTFRLPVRIVNETAWHNLFSRNMFIIPKSREEFLSHEPEFTVYNMPMLHANPEFDGTNSPVFVIVHFGRKIVLIGGTSYAGEIKKSMFTVMNYLLPLKNVMSMHCSANVGKKGDVALLFGLSGTGKTTLSADPLRKLIGDDEHGWSDDGTFNFEGGCYAKVINLSKEAEPDIYETTRMFGTVLENVAIDSETRKLNLDDASLTENTRAAYPLTHIPNIVPEGLAGHPKNIIFLTADAFGVLPPVSKLNKEQAMYHFLSGYTAKVAGTEKGVKDPQATFSACFGEPFMVHHPSVYAKLLGEKMEKYGVNCWLVNTGWSGGPYGIGSRIKIKYTRAMLNAALDGRLDGVSTWKDPFFNLEVPNDVPDIPAEILNPRNTWADKEAYDKQAKKLANMFNDNFKKFEEQVTPEIRTAGPNKFEI